MELKRNISGVFARRHRDDPEMIELYSKKGGGKTIVWACIHTDMLWEMKGQKIRSARFKTCVALVDAKGNVYLFRVLGLRQLQSTLDRRLIDDPASALGLAHHPVSELHCIGLA